MRPDRRSLLETHQVQLTQNLDLDTVVPFLQAARVIPDSVVETVNKHSGLKARLELLKSIKIRGDDAFHSLYEAFVFSKQDNLASLLRPLVLENDENIEESLSQLLPSGKSSVSWVDEEPMQLTGQLNLPVEGTDGPSTKEQLEIWHKNSGSIYPNFSSPKGHCLIINNYKFSSMPHRKGTEVDCANVTTLFRNLGYKVTIHSDLTAKEMSNVATLFAQDKDHGSSLIVVILTHGEHQVLIGSDGEVVYINNLLSKFNSKNAPHLTGKPKIFLFQACRGDSYDNGVVSSEKEETDSGTMLTDVFKIFSSLVKSKTSKPQELHLPNECDFFIGYATTPGYVSWRNSLHGSWFIQAVCEVFNRHAKEFHICEMMTLVNRRIAHGNVTSNKNKQMPEYSNRLRKKFYFFPGVSQP